MGASAGMSVEAHRAVLGGGFGSDLNVGRVPGTVNGSGLGVRADVVLRKLVATACVIALVALATTAASLRPWEGTGPSSSATWPDAAGIAATFDATGPTFDLGAGRLISLGDVRYDDVTTASELASTTSEDARYRHGAALTSWYRRVPAGVEHGFVLAHPPARTGATTVTVEQQVVAPGLFPLVDDSDVTWVDIRGAVAASYTGLTVFDAEGTELTASLDTDGAWLTYTIDTAGATWPVIVDPILAVPPGPGGKLIPPKSAAGDEFAHAVDISGDTAIVGAASDDASSGSAYIFTRSGTTWTQVTKLRADDANANDQFGHTVAVDGDTALVSSHLDDDGFNSSGSVYVFTADSAGVWTQQVKLHATDPSPGARFGHGLALSGDTAVVGADSASAAYVFTRDAVSGTWSAGTRIDATNGSDGDNFGFSVAFDAGTVLVGAYLDDQEGKNAGAAYVFVQDALGTWTQQAKLLPATIGPGDYVGFGVSLDGDTAALSSHLDDDEGSNAGAAYVFVRGSDGTWTEETKLTAGDAEAGDRFGFSVTVSGDTLVAGGHLDDDQAEDTGSAYVFTRTGTSWAQQAKLANPDPAPGDRFGRNVSLDGSTVLVGAHWDDEGGLDAGAAYAFEGAGTSWAQQDKLVPDDPDSGAQAGRSVDIDGDTAVIGAPLEPEGGNQAGVAYVFTRGTTGWVREAKLSPEAAAPFDWFGFSVALSGDTAVISAHLDDEAATDAGAAYVYTRSGTTWTLQEKLTAPTGNVDDRLGFDLDVEADTALIGAPLRGGAGSALVFTRTGDSWSFQAELTGSTAAAGDDVGFSVALDGDRAIVGAPLDDEAGTDAGSAYAFQRSGTEWILDEKLMPAAAGAGDNIGWDVAASDDRALIGAPLDDEDANDAGAAYVFRRGASWAEEAKLVAGDALARDHVGIAVALEGATALLGADFDDHAGSDSGAAYVFGREAGSWTRQQRITATSAAADDRFGRAVALSGPFALVGIPGDDDRGVDAGAAEVFSLVRADAGGPYEVPEGASVPLDASASLAHGLVGTWDLDGDGIFGETGTDAESGDETGLVPTFLPVGSRSGDVVDVVFRASGDAGTIDDATTVTITDPVVVPPPPPPPPPPAPAPAPTGGSASGSGNGVTVTVTSTTGAAPQVAVTTSSNGSAPRGHALLPMTAQIIATGDGDDPVTIRFTVPTADLPAVLPGHDLPHVTVVRDGSVVAPCTTPGSLAPDPCVSSRTPSIAGLALEVLTSAGSDWTLGVPSGACTVGVPAHGFSDLSGNRHATSIACTRWWELINGTSATAYSPGLDLTRGQLATVLVGLLDQLGVALPDPLPDAFGDDDGSVHEGAIDTLAALGIYRGRADGTSGVSAPIDRGQVATLLLGSLAEAGLPVPASPPNAFGDDDGATHEPSLDALAAMGIYRGTGDGNAGHRASLRRDQAASLLTGALEAWYGG